MESLGGAGLPSISSMLPIAKSTVDALTNGRDFNGSTRSRPEESASQSLHTLLQVEEQRLRREEQRTRQETLKLDQRRVEQNMLRDALEAGVPSHMIPLIFVGNDGVNVQTYAAMLEHTSHARTSARMHAHPHMSSHQFPTSSSRSHQRPRYPSPPAATKGRAYSVVDIPHRGAPKGRSYSFVDNGPSPAGATSMAPPGSRMSYASRPSFSGASNMFDQPSKHLAQQWKNGLAEEYAPHRQPMNSSSLRSYSVSDANSKDLAKNGAGSAAPPHKSINFCHWKPPAEMKQSSKSPRDSQNPGQQSHANQKANEEEVPTTEGKRKASVDPDEEVSTSRRKSMKPSRADVHSRQQEHLYTNSERHNSLSVDEHSPVDDRASPGVSRPSSGLPAAAASADAAARSPHSEPLSPGPKRAVQRKGQSRQETQGKMNIRFVDGLTPQRGLPNSRNYVIDSTALSADAEDMPPSNGYSQQQQFAFVAGYSMGGLREHSPPVEGVLHDFSARRGSLPV